MDSANNKKGRPNKVWWTKERIEKCKEILGKHNTLKEALVEIQKVFDKKISRKAIFNGFISHEENPPSTFCSVKFKGECLGVTDYSEDEVILEKLINILKKNYKAPIPFWELCNKLDLSPKKLEVLLQQAKSLGYKINVSVDKINLDKTESIETLIKPIVIPTVEAKRLRLCAISDLHAGSDASLPNCVTNFVERVYNDYSVRTIFCAGDLLAGDSVYKSQIAELNHWGCQKQCNELSAMLPQKEGLSYWSILGNHDINFKKTAGIDAGFVIQALRPDIKILGEIKASFDIENFPITVELIHIKSNSYSRSYPLEKHIAKAVSKGNHPDIIFAGHLHVGGFFILNGIYAIMCPCFESSNLFVKYHDFVPTVGGLIVDLIFDEQMHIIRCEPIFFLYNTQEPTKPVIRATSI